jgi:hypothetical protein
VVDGDAEIPLVGHGRFSRVQTHSHSELRVVRPRVLGERPLRRGRGEHRVLRPRERSEERVSLSVDLVASVLAEGGAQQMRMVLQSAGVTVAELSRQLRGSFDVGEQERDRSRWKRHPSETYPAVGGLHALHASLDEVCVVVDAAVRGEPRAAQLLFAQVHRLDMLDIATPSRRDVVRSPFVGIRAAGVLVGVGTAGDEGRRDAHREEVGNRGDVVLVSGATHAFCDLTESM